MTIAIKNEEHVHQLAAAAPSGRDRLVFIRCGQNAALAQELATPGRGYDILLSLYQPCPLHAPLAAAGVAVYAGGLSKFHAAKRIEEKFGTLSTYEFVLFLDADLQIDAPSVRRLFELAARRGLDLCQASLTAESSTLWPFLHHDPAAAETRRCNFVEVMGPCFSRTALMRCLPTFDRSISGWGLDFLWPALLGFRGIAAINAVQMTHLGMPDPVNGTFYRYLKSMGVDPDREYDAILAQDRPRCFTPGWIGPLLGWRGPYLRRLLPRTVARWSRSIRKRLPGQRDPHRNRQRPR